MFRPMRLTPIVLSMAAFLGCGGSHENRGEAAPGATTASPASAAPSTPKHPSAPAGSGATPAPLLDARKAVATVNGVPVPLERVESVYRMNRVMLEQRGRMMSPAENQALREQSLETALADELLFQAAVAKGVTVTGAEIDAAMKQIRQRAGNEDAYSKMLAQSGLTERDVLREVERNLRTEAFRKSLVAGRSVSDGEAKRYYDANVPKGIFNVPERVHVQYILVKAGEKDPESVRADARKRAEEAARRAGAGEDFAALARQYSQDPTAARGGDIGRIPRGVRFPQFDEVVFAAKPGAVSAVFETPNGFNVVKVLEKRPASTQGFDEVKAELMREMGLMLEHDVVIAKIKELAETAKIAILDHSYQTDTAEIPAGSAPK